MYPVNDYNTGHREPLIGKGNKIKWWPCKFIDGSKAPMNQLVKTEENSSCLGLSVKTSEMVA